MTTADQFALANYKQIAVLNEDHGVYLVQHQKSRNIYVKKTLSVYNLAVFQYLQDNHIRGIPQIIEVIENENTLTVIEEYISGRTVQSFLDDGNLFSEPDAVRIVVELCRILSVLHAQTPAIVHRDIKPSNIMLTPDGDVRLIDMNAAKQFNNEKHEDTALIGTVGYAAPEQYGFGTSGVQADIYAVGVLLNVMLLGKPPKEVLPEGKIGKTIKKCTMIDPKDRYSSVAELVLDLDKDASSALPGIKPSPFSRYMIPGFRTSNPSNMVSAVAGYSLIMLLGLTLTVQNARSDASLWIDRVFFIVICLSIVFITFNYRDTWRILQIDRIKNTWLKTLALIAADAVVIIVLLVVMAIVEARM